MFKVNNQDILYAPFLNMSKANQIIANKFFAGIFSHEVKQGKLLWVES